MTNDELSISDVLADEQKNFCNIYLDSAEDNEAQNLSLTDSLYYTETDFVDFISSRKFSNKQNLTIISLNIANLLAKLRSFKLFINNITTSHNRPDIIIVVETHISKSTNTGYTDKEIRSILPGYEFFHKGRTVKKGGGVGIFVSKQLAGDTKILDQIRFTEEQFENIIVQIPNVISTGNSNLKKDIIIAAIYRQPNNNNHDTFITELEQLLRSVDKKRNELVLAGDINLDLLKYETHLPTANYIDVAIHHKLLPRIVRPTRIKKQSATLIDHILTKDSGISIVSGIIDTEIAGTSGFTDHFPTFTILRTNTDKKVKREHIVKSFFTQENSQLRKDRLRRENWTEVLDQDDPNVIYDMIQERYGHHYNETKTTKTFKRGSNHNKREPWMTMEILADIRKRDRLAKQKARRGDYKQLRNKIVSDTRKAERDYMNQQIQDSYGDVKRHWDIIRKATNKANNKEETIDDFYYQGLLITDPQKNAENCNAYFASIGRETNNSVGSPTWNSLHYLQKHANRNQDSLLFCDVTQQDIVEACRKFSPKTSTDAAGFQQNIILSDIGILAPVLAHLVNCSQKSGIFPERGKIARVIPVYKGKGSKQLFENYRPISLLPIFSKIIERLIYNKVFEFLVRYEILFESQFGFRRGHNTTHATLDFIKTIEESIEAGNYAIGIFCDLS